jgi:hypothetical protein
MATTVEFRREYGVELSGAETSKYQLPTPRRPLFNHALTSCVYGY